MGCSNAILLPRAGRSTSCRRRSSRRQPSRRLPSRAGRQPRPRWRRPGKRLRRSGKRAGCSNAILLPRAGRSTSCRRRSSRRQPSRRLPSRAGRQPRPRWRRPRKRLRRSGKRAGCSNAILLPRARKIGASRLMVSAVLRVSNVSPTHAPPIDQRRMQRSLFRRRLLERSREKSVSVKVRKPARSVRRETFMLPTALLPTQPPIP